MTHTSHTPGPWRYTGEKVCEQQTDDVIAQPGRNFSIINPSQTLEANARLIAEAPAMYNAIRLAALELESVWQGKVESNALTDIRAIIERIEQ